MRTNTSIVRSFFVSNTAGNYQGHVEVLAHIKRDNSYAFSYPWPNIQSNSARVGGSLIITSSTVNISSSHSESNTANVGGAIFSELGSNINISNCTLSTIVPQVVVMIAVTVELCLLIVAVLSHLTAAPL